MMDKSNNDMVSMFSGFQALTSGAASILVPNIRSRRRSESTPSPVKRVYVGEATHKLDRAVESSLLGWDKLFNIFSHIIGALLFLSLPCYIFSTEVPPRYQVATTADMVVCSMYFLSVGICFALSTIFHTLMSHSEAVYMLGIKLDYQGILLLMWGSTIPLAYYSFPCRTSLQLTYWAVTTTLAGLCSIATFHPSIGGPHLGHIRAMLFGSFGFGSFLVPIAHGIVLYGFVEQSRKIGLGWIGVTVLCNAIGVVAYSLKIPEIWYPRSFDIFGASHQIMHVMVVFAALAYSFAVLEAFDYRYDSGISC